MERPEHAVQMPLQRLRQARSPAPAPAAESAPLGMLLSLSLSEAETVGRETAQGDAVTL